MCLLALKKKVEEKKARKVVLSMWENEKIDSIIKIQSTEFDRKRKYDDTQIAIIRKEFLENGMSVSDIAHKYNMNYTTVRYNVDDNFKASYNKKRDGKHSGVDVCDFLNRVAYKKSLIKNKKIKVLELVSNEN